MANEKVVMTPDGKKKTRVNKLFSVCLYILVVEACERLCYYTIFNSQVSFFEDAGCNFNTLTDTKTSCMSASGAFALRSSFRMLAYVFPIVGGYLADNVLGRYKTILWFTTAYVAGVVLMAVAAIPSIMKTTTSVAIYIIGAFVFMAIGTGAIKPNVINFGAEQYDTSDPDEAAQQKAYFSYFYMVINIGSIFSAIWTVSLATGGVSSTGAGTGFVKSFTIAAVAMALALLTFLLGTPKYTEASKAAVTKTPLLSVIRRHISQAAREGVHGKISILGFVLLPVYLIVTLIGSLLRDSQPTFLQFGTAHGITACSAIAFVLCVISSAALIFVHKNNDWVKPLAHVPHQVSNMITTEEVKSALRVIPTVMCINIGFNVGYNGMDIYGAAACQMDVRAPDVQWLRDFLLLPQGQLNGNFFSLGNNASIIIAIPILEGFLFPKLKQMLGKPIPRKAKYVAGFSLIVLANFIGVAIELVRRTREFIPCPVDLIGSDQCGPYNNVGNYLLSQCSPGGTLPMSNMNGWWTFIPYFITGCGEVLVNPVLQEFTFDEVAPRLRSLMMGFTLIAMGCTPSVITAIFSGFVPNDMNNGPVIWCYLANNSVSIVLLIAYFFIAIPDKTVHELEKDVPEVCTLAVNPEQETNASAVSMISV